MMAMANWHLGLYFEIFPLAGIYFSWLQNRAKFGILRSRQKSAGESVSIKNKPQSTDQETHSEMAEVNLNLSIGILY